MRIKIGDIVCVKVVNLKHVKMCPLPEHLDGEIGEVITIDPQNTPFKYEVKIHKSYEMWKRSYMCLGELCVLGSVL